MVRKVDRSKMGWRGCDWLFQLAGKLRPSTQWLEFTNHTNSYSPLRQQYKTKTRNNTDVKCRICGKAMESVPRVLSGCSTLAQSKYKTRHDAALKVLFFDLLCDMGLIESAPSWCSPETPKPEYKNDRASALCCASVCREDGSKSKSDWCKSCW